MPSHEFDVSRMRVAPSVPVVGERPAPGQFPDRSAIDSPVVASNVESRAMVQTHQSGARGVH